MIYIIWAVFTAALIFLFSYVSNRIGYIRGYSKGATKVLEEWKQFMNNGGMDNDQQ